VAFQVTLGLDAVSFSGRAFFIGGVGFGTPSRFKERGITATGEQYETSSRFVKGALSNADGSPSHSSEYCRKSGEPKFHA
jgi:hypothetical protein